MKNNLHPFSLTALLPGPPRRVLALLVILALFLLNAAWNVPFAPPPSHPPRLAPTRTSVPTLSNLVNTPDAEEILTNHTETNGIAILGAFIVLVIVAGTFFVLRRKG